MDSPLVSFLSALSGDTNQEKWSLGTRCKRIEPSCLLRSTVDWFSIVIMNNNTESTVKQMLNTERAHKAIQDAAMSFIEEPEYDQHYVHETSRWAGALVRFGHYEMRDLTDDENARVSLVDDLIGNLSIELAKQIRNTPEGKKLLEAAWATVKNEHLSD